MTNKISYEDFEYDTFLKRSKPAHPEFTEDITQIERPQIPEVSIRGLIPKRKIEDAIRDSTQITSITTVSASVGNNEGVRLTSTISDNANPEKIMNGVCETAAYQDNIGVGSSVIPYGSNTIAGNYKVDRFYDLHRNELVDHPGKSLSYTVHIQNGSGSTHTIAFYIRWRYSGKETVT